VSIDLNFFDSDANEIQKTSPAPFVRTSELEEAANTRLCPNKNAKISVLSIIHGPSFFLPILFHSLPPLSKPAFNVSHPTVDAHHSFAEIY
jgi:hypothetical protein